MIVPESTTPWILQHRSAALGDPKSAYSRLIREDYEEMKKWLPARVTDILDIGCGLAGIDSWLYERYGHPVINLLDGSGEVENASNRIGFHVHGMKPFNDMSVARELLELNGVSPEEIQMWPVGYSGDAIRCDLCISLLSWGWHYPIETYLDLVWDSLSDGGRLILDVRAGTGGDNSLDAKGFIRTAVIRTGPKGWRLCYERPPRKGRKYESSVFS